MLNWDKGLERNVDTMAQTYTVVGLNTVPDKIHHMANSLTQIEVQWSWKWVAEYTFCNNFTNT